MKRCIHCGTHLIPTTPLGASVWRHEWSGFCTCGPDFNEWGEADDVLDDEGDEPA